MLRTQQILLEQNPKPYNCHPAHKIPNHTTVITSIQLLFFFWQIYCSFLQNSIAIMESKLPYMELYWYLSYSICTNITKTCLFKYIENFTTKKGKFSDKNFDIFHSFAQNIDCGYSLEPPRWGSSNEYLQSMFLGRNKKNTQFYYIKVGFKGVEII